MKLQAVVDKIESEGLGVPGQTLFRDQMPSSVNDALLVASKTPFMTHPYVHEYRKGQIQLIARTSSEDNSRSKLESVITALASNGRQIFGSAVFLRFWPAHEPLVYSRSSADLVEASVNFDVVFIK